jgi:hypothetical protein
VVDATNPVMVTGHFIGLIPNLTFQLERRSEKLVYLRIWLSVSEVQLTNSKEIDNETPLVVFDPYGPGPL